MYAWILVFVAGLFEIGFAAALKQSDGLTRPVPTLVFIELGTASFLVLSRALRWLPIGTAYAAWTGIGGAGTAIVGMIFLGEPVETIRLVSIALILSGVVGLQLSSRRNDRVADGDEVQLQAGPSTGEIRNEV